MGDPWATLQALETDRRSGAAEIAEQAAVAVARMHRDDAERALEGLLRAHPSMAPLWWLASAVEDQPDVWGAAMRFIELLAFDDRAASMLAASLPETIVTISYSSSVAAAIRARRPAQVACMRSDPGGEGLRMARRISRWTRATVVEDEEALRDLPGEAVLTGADAVTPTHAVNKVKTRALAEAAARHGRPCYAVAGETKFVDRALPLLEPFEAVPLELFTSIGTPGGLLPPAQASAHAARARVHRAWWPALDELQRRLDSKAPPTP